MLCDSKYDEFINISKNRAKSILALFFDRLGYHNLFNHLFNIEIYIDYKGIITYEDACAVYNHDRNIINDFISSFEEKKLETTITAQYHSIWINYNYIKTLFNKYVNGSKSLKEASIFALSETIIHEIIHENRAILRKYDNTLNNLEYIYACDKKNKLINHEYLCLVRNKTEELLFKENLSGEVLITSCRGSKNYDIFYDTDIKLYNIKDLNGNIIEQIDDAIIYGYDDEVYLPSSFYNKKNLNDKIYDIKEDVKKRIINQRGIEESLTEALTNMIFISNFYDRFDLEEAADIVIHDKQITLDVKAACYIYKTFGYDFLNWFILSSYQDEYTDLLEDIFEENYDKVLEMFTNLYANKKDIKCTNEYYELLNIIKNCKKSKKSR